MKIDREEALIILELMGEVSRHSGSSVKEEIMENRIRIEFAGDKEVSEYDYQEQADKHGW